MITEYLLKKKEEFIERKSQMESLLNSLNATIREDNKMIELLEPKNKPAFNDFSPRGNRNDTRVKELNDQIEENLEKASKLKIKIDDIDRQLKELEEVIKEARLLEKSTSDPAGPVVSGSTGEKTDEDIVIEEESDGQMSFEKPDESGEHTNETADSKMLQYKTFIIEELENIQKFLPSDPFRTKIEILQLIKKLK